MILLKGGRGGQGNARFATATNKAPKFAQPGEPGEERWLKLELKLMADVGLLGFPSVGKSSFIAKVSAARPKIADYPFTTLTPNLGVVPYKNYRSFVIADIPGLIEGAHEGAGLGHRFLKHVERTDLLLHILDISWMPERDPIREYEAINRELALFNAELARKRQIIVINKLDLPVVRENLPAGPPLVHRARAQGFPHLRRHRRGDPPAARRDRQEPLGQSGRRVNLYHREIRSISSARGPGTDPQEKDHHSCTGERDVLRQSAAGRSSPGIGRAHVEVDHHPQVVVDRNDRGQDADDRQRHLPSPYGGGKDEELADKAGGRRNAGQGEHGKGQNPSLKRPAIAESPVIFQCRRLRSPR